MAEQDQFPDCPEDVRRALCHAIWIWVQYGPRDCEIVHNEAGNVLSASFYHGFASTGEDFGALLEYYGLGEVIRAEVVLTQKGIDMLNSDLPELPGGEG